jgi:tyrosine-protein phosphatase MSG5
MDLEARRPSFQAILPPSGLEQPEAINGFTSLNSTAQAAPVLPPVTPLRSEESRSSDSTIKVDNLFSSPAAQPTAPADPHTPVIESIEAEPSSLTQTPERLFLSTPSKSNSIRTRFSSPNLREQRRLHKLQTEMEALLPHRLPHPPQAADDLDALMSPRAEEFTRNPFHVNFRAADNDASPASSNETIKEGHLRSEWSEPQPLPQQHTPHKAVEDDPRSPVQTGSSPITRNIWDVLWLLPIWLPQKET